MFRKVFTLFSLIFAVLGILIDTCLCAEADWIPDAALREAVRETLELPARVPLTKDHM